MGVALRIGHVGLAAILAAQGAAPTSLAAQPTGRAPYTATLAQAAALTPRELAQEQRQFMAWLQTNGASLPPDQLQGAREHLYFLVGSAARAQLSATGRLFPPRDTLGLAEMLDEGTRLGLFGAGVVARALIGAAAAEHLAPPVLPAAPFHLSFSAPEYTLRSAHGWSVRFPYYFMIGGLQVSMPNNGVETEMIVLSTLFADHRGLPGRSQATLLLLGAMPNDTSAFYAFWLNAVQLGTADRVSETLLPGSTTYRGFDTARSMNKELVTLTRGRMAFVLVYSGLPGTFEMNRADARAVFESLSVETPTR
jgi:hypothetical protein